MERLEVVVRQQSGTHSADLTTLRISINQLQEVHAFYDGHHRDQIAKHRVQQLANSLTNELVAAVEILFTTRPDVGKVHTICNLAAELDGVRLSSASAIVGSRVKQLQRQLAQGHLTHVGTAVQRLREPALVARSAGSVVAIIVDAVPSVREVPDLISQLLHLCGSLREKMLECVQVMIEDNPTVITSLLGAATSLDSVCIALATHHGTGWRPLVEQVLEVRSQKAGELASRFTGALEAELEMASPPDFQEVSRLLAFLEALWVEPAADVATRVGVALASIEKGLRAAFDVSLAAGEGDRLDSYLRFARELVGRRSVLDPRPGQEDSEALARDFEKKIASVTLKVLLANAQGSVAARSQELHALFTVADAQLREVRPRERLRERAAGHTWRFKLGNGSFKDFSAAKSAEVEALYQAWLAKGKPTEDSERRCTISIHVDSAARPRSGALTSSGQSLGGDARPPCKFGVTCYRKNPQHLRDFAHPTDPDWPGEQTPACDVPSIPNVPTSSSVSEERYSLDFMLMKQVNVSRGRRPHGMRNINRIEGRTLAQQHTHVYFAKVVDFVKEMTNMLAQAEVEMRFLGEMERDQMKKQMDQLLGAIQPALAEFLGLAVYIEDMKAIEDVVALLGVHAEGRGLGLKDSLKKVRLRDVREELRQAYCIDDAPAGVKKWSLLRLMWKRQKAVGPLFYCRCALVKTKDEVRTLIRRHVQIRCQALLSAYESDEDFCESFRRIAGEILGEALRGAVAQNAAPAELLQTTLRTAVQWQCDLKPMLQLAGGYVRESLEGAGRSKLQPLARVVEVLDTGQDIAKAAGKVLGDLCSEALLLPLLALFSEKAAREVEQFVNISGDAGRLYIKLPAVVKQVVDVRMKLRSDGLAARFDEDLWRHFKEWYEPLINASTHRQTCAIEWAIAYCEQTSQPLPPWMMNKPQVEALRKLQAARESGDEGKLRAAVIFAKQADYKSDQQLLQLYEGCVGQLKVLKRLPSGWEVNELVGDDAEAMMFRIVDLTGDKLKELFQRMFDETNAGIVTRDRAGAMPRGYRVEKIETVMNAESWGSYLKRTDAIADECKRFPGAAPVVDWDSWSGPVATADLGRGILDEARLPALAGGSNEFLMFHGTKPEAANSIAKNHFDMAFACKTGLFGAGLYFAESSSKSDEYVKSDHVGWFPVVMCRVTLGRVNYIASPDPTTDPGRDKMEGSCLRGDYHSVLGDRKKARGTYREFIVYDHYQVYPHFIVWYSRLGG